MRPTGPTIAFMEVLPLIEPGHRGYLVRAAKRALVIDPPLDTDAAAEFLPSYLELAGIVDTGIPSWRISGGRLLAELTGAPRYAPPGVAAAVTLRDRIPGFPEAGVVAAPGYGAGDIALVVGDLLFVGDLDGNSADDDDAAARVAGTRADLAERFSAHVAYGTEGSRPGASLAALPEPVAGPRPLNAEAVQLTNRGEADMYWADPRFTGETHAIDADRLRARLGSPWAPTVLDLRRDGEAIDGAVRLAPARVASEIGGLPANREVVVLADSGDVAAAAAGFLARLGFQASWVAG